MGSERYRGAVGEALRLLGVERLVFGIQDQSFPRGGGVDFGRGSPGSAGGLELLRFVSGLGFTGVQFGPQGLTPEHSPSPYEGALFSRSLISIRPDAFASGDTPWGELLAGGRLEEISSSRPPGSDARVSYGFAWRASREALEEAFASFRRGLAGREASPLVLAGKLKEFRRRQALWLEKDSLYEVLRRVYGPSDPRLWHGGATAEIDRRLWTPAPGTAGSSVARRRELWRDGRETIELYAFSQFIAHEEHERLREESRVLGLRLYGDLQVGFSDRDSWAWQGLFLPGYRMGAPPSRTNPEGQAWGYPVLHPGLYGSRDRPGPVLRLLETRMGKLFSEYDALRVDHPHGLVCPWVYRGEGAAPEKAVLEGARLFSAPDSAAHGALRAFAIPSREQLNDGSRTRPWADDWVADLREDQVERYATLFQTVVDAALSRGKGTSDIVPEVLSSMPYPLKRVLGRYGLGRFRVTQKADPRSEGDPYRSENARPEDWIMVGNHDTPSLWRLAGEWEEGEALEARAAYLARRLEAEHSRREALARELLRDRRLLVQAHFADLFVGPARSVMVFFTDLFGQKESYNRPGVVSKENWSLRLPSTWRPDYLRRAARHEALNIPWALALALGSRPDLPAGGAAGLRRELLFLATALS